MAAHLDHHPNGPSALAELRGTVLERRYALGRILGADGMGAEVNRRSRHEAAAIVASGVVGMVGGAALVGAGAWTLGAADELRDAQLAALAADAYPNEDGLRDDLDQWHRRGRVMGTGLVVGGAALAAAGIGLTVWGAVKLRRAGKGPSPRAGVVLPMVGAEGVGMVARVVF